MTLLDSVITKIQNRKHLKLIYSAVYLKCCIITAYVHLIRYSSDYTQVLDIKDLETRTLNEISENRGIREANKFYSEDRASLEQLIADSGVIYNSELTSSPLTNQHSEAKIFNSAGEFQESVEDSPHSPWLVHIIMDDGDGEPADNLCNKSKFLREETWQRLNSLSKFFQTGTFNCAKDPLFCSLKGWSRPALVLGMAAKKSTQQDQSKEIVDFFYYTDCAHSHFEAINEWLETTLKKILLSPYKAVRKQFSSVIRKGAKSTELKIFYQQYSTKSSRQIPFYFSAISLKYNQHAKFYYVTRRLENSPKPIYNWKFDSVLQSKATDSKTPIYLVIDDHTCYNYGANLNELPNYAHLNLFLMFLYPDMNSIFLTSFMALNAYLLMFFFEYNKSLLKQLGRGLFYVCIFNFVLFAIWLMQNHATNSGIKELNDLFSLLNTGVSHFGVWCRFFMMYNQLTQAFVAHVRFIFFYHIYIQPLVAVLVYIVVLVVYYWQSRLHSQSALLKSSQCIKSKQVSVPSRSVEQQCSITNGTAPPPSQPLLSESPEIEIGLQELINQINGPTSIWLQSSTHADRFILELPHIEYCKCFFLNTVKLLACDETDIESTEGTENEDEERAAFCECGRNRELNAHLEQSSCGGKIKFDRECAICLEKYAYNCVMVLLPCKHSFHRQCIYEWFMNSLSYNLTCPICRTSFYKSANR